MYYARYASLQMAPWVRKVFIDVLPKYLFIQRPPQEDDDDHLTLFDDSGHNKSTGENSEESVEVKYLVESPFLGYTADMDKCGALSPPLSSGMRGDRSEIKRTGDDVPVTQSPTCEMMMCVCVCTYFPTRSSPTESQGVSPAIEKAVNALKFVAQHVKNEDNFEGVSCCT